MTRLRWIAAGLLLVSLSAGTFSDSAPRRQPVMLGGYHVLAVDFHVHSFPLSWSTLAPWDTVMEAERQGLDVIAIVGHNHLWVSKLGRWSSRFSGGLLVLTGEEIVSARYHLLAIGIESTIDWKQTAASPASRSAPLCAMVEKAGRGLSSARKLAAANLYPKTAPEPRDR